MNGTNQLSCTLVVPCHNERERLDLDAFRVAEQEFPWLRLLFVDDGSTDGTAEALHGFRVLHLDKRQGKAGAVRAGILAALQEIGSNALVGFLDADLATPIEDFARLCLELNESPELDAVFGSRWRHLGGAIARQPMRALSGAAMAASIRWVTKLPVHDSQCGAKVFRANAARTLFRDPFTSPWLFDVELLFRMPTGMHAEEFPLRYWEERAGSKLRLLDMAMAPLELLKLAWRYTRKPSLEAERNRCNACIDC